MTEQNGLRKEERVKLTPDFAEELLGYNWHNRNMSHEHALDLGARMERGEWRYYGGDPLLIGEFEGRKVVIDGQHRILGVILSGIAIEVDITWGVPLEIQDIIDDGRIRTLANTLGLKGRTSARSLGSTLVWYFKWINGKVMSGNSRRNRPSRPQALVLLEDNPNMPHSVKQGNKLKALMPATMAATLHYAFAQVSSEDVEEFFRLCQTGDGVESGNPIYAFRRRCLVQAQKADRLPTQHQGAWLVKAWNAWITGDELHTMKWRPGGKKPERFPHVHGWEYDGEVPVRAVGLD